MKRRRRSRANPKSSEAGTVALWVVTIGAIIGAAYGLKYMTDAQRKDVLGV